MPRCANCDQEYAADLDGCPKCVRRAQDRFKVMGTHIYIIYLVVVFTAVLSVIGWVLTLITGGAIG